MGKSPLSLPGPIAAPRLRTPTFPIVTRDTKAPANSDAENNPSAIWQLEPGYQKMKRSKPHRILDSLKAPSIAQKAVSALRKAIPSTVPKAESSYLKYEGPSAPKEPRKPGALKPLTFVDEEPEPEPDAPIDLKHGQQIYVYHHLQKNHVVYSFDKALNNRHALSQIPYNGKKTVPRALRKDLWAPLATLTFPFADGAIGRSVFQKLREFRRRHELEWKLKDYNRDEKGNLLTRKLMTRKLADQKANSIADIAAVLYRLSTKFPEEASKKDSLGKIGLVGEGTGTKVEVKWTNIYDNAFARSWSENVTHSYLHHPTNNRDWEAMIGNSAKKQREFAEVKVKLEALEKERHVLKKKVKLAGEEGKRVPEDAAMLKKMRAESRKLKESFFSRKAKRTYVEKKLLA